MKASQESSNETVESEAQRIIEQLSPVREQLVRSILSRFPMRGLEQILREAFDSAVTENISIFSSLLSTELPQEATLPEAAPPENSQSLHSRQSIQQDLQVALPEKSQYADMQGDTLKSITLEKANNFEKAISEGKISEREDVESEVSRLRKEIDRLVLELKVRDRKIREQERLIANMKAMAEQGALKPSLGQLKPSLAAIHPSHETLQSLWSRINKLLEKDPKFKILRLLMIAHDLTLDKIYQTLGVPKQLVARYLEELKDAGLIQVIGDTVSLKL